MRDTKQALQWITNILNKNKIPFQIVGGLAAKAHGAKRKLWDIDIYIPEKYKDKIVEKTKKYIVWGPKQIKQKNWDLEYMKIMYAEQKIEIGFPEKTKLFDTTKKKWFQEKIDFSKSELKELFNIEVSVMPKKELIDRKKKLGRKVDKLDLKQMQ